jgi:hypothetical protein
MTIQERVPDVYSEARLAEIRREAEQRGKVAGSGIRPAGAPFPKASPETGYYGIHLLKEPQWEPTIPAYFFVGGAAGACAVIAACADWLAEDPKLARTARWIAFGGSLVSSAALIEDLGRPARFLNMLRVFKIQSPMSVGAWTLAAFGSMAGATVFAKEAERTFGDRFPVHVVGNIAQFFTAALGLPFHNYTGVLIGATAIPVWNENIGSLPMHFGASGVHSGVSVLELLGNADNRALNLLGIAATFWETMQGIQLEARTDEVLTPLKRGRSGWVTRVGGVLSGPVPLAMRVLAGNSPKVRKLAALSGIAGSLLTRFGWVAAGRASARDWRLPLGIPPEVARETFPKQKAQAPKRLEEAA